MKKAGFSLKQATGWLTWLLVGGLVAVYLGERAAKQVEVARLIFSGGGFLLVLLATFWRFVAWRAAKGDAQRVERLFLLTSFGCLLSLVGFFLAGNGYDWLNIDF